MTTCCDFVTVCDARCSFGVFIELEIVKIGEELGKIRLFQQTCTEKTVTCHILSLTVKM